jgi:hypothetical protein
MNANETAHEHVEGLEEDEEAELEGGMDVQQVLEAASAYARENPHAALGIAAGIGFLLGGGLTPKLLGGAAMIAGRSYLGKTIRESLVTVLEEKLGAAERG